MSGNVLTLLYLITLFTSITTPQSPKSILVLIGIPVFRGIPNDRGDRTFFSIRVLQIHGNWDLDNRGPPARFFHHHSGTNGLHANTNGQRYLVLRKLNPLKIHIFHISTCLNLRIIFGNAITPPSEVMDQPPSYEYVLPM